MIETIILISLISAFKVEQDLQQALREEKEQRKSVVERIPGKDW